MNCTLDHITLSAMKIKKDLSSSSSLLSKTYVSFKLGLGQKILLNMSLQDWLYKSCFSKAPPEKTGRIMHSPLQEVMAV